MPPRDCDALVFGGGFAGLWILERLVSAGFDALLIEKDALGRGQSVQAQGIVHGGGKYALRGVRDFSAAAAIREMPSVWRASLEGRDGPDLSSAQILSPSCLLWVPRSGWLSRLSAWGLLPVVQKAGLLHAKPRRLPTEEWPAVLRRSARAVYSMPEPVIATGSALDALSRRHPDRLLRVGAADILGFHSKPDGQVIVSIASSGVSGERRELELCPRVRILAAGEGNEELMQRMGLRGEPMQRRPLLMALLKGDLPELFGHCVRGGKTAMTVTTHPWQRAGAADAVAPRVWQIGGEVAEAFAGRDDSPEFDAAVSASLGEMLPGLDRDGLELAAYVAVRAEARSSKMRRPSGVHARWVEDRVLVTWPTKMALTPLLGDEVVREMAERIGAPTGAGTGVDWPRPEVAVDPWREEGLRWRTLT